MTSRGVGRWVVGGLWLVLSVTPVTGQDLDPRAYARFPVKMRFVIGGFGYSDGGIVTDATSPVQDAHATVESASLGAGTSFGLFGQTAQIFAVLPYSWAQASGLVGGQATSITRAGLSDMRIRLSVLVHGAPALTRAEMAGLPHRTVLGTSLTVVAPTGQNDSTKLVNLGSNRWAFRPELAISQPVGERWLVDAYAGVWLFTANDAYYPGTSVRTQDPMSAVQAHVSYTLKSQAWAAFDATFYTGGRSTVNGVPGADRQSNTRVGATVVFPVGTRHSVKVACSTGAVVRFGANFTTLSVAWQTGWFGSGTAPSR